MLTNEIVISKNKMQLSDFQELLRDLKKSENYLFDFTMVENIDSDILECTKVFCEIIDKCEKAVLIAPAFFQPIVDKVNHSNFLYIVRSKFDTHLNFSEETVDLIKKISIDYFKGQFGDLNFKDVQEVPVLNMSAKVQVSVLGQQYLYTVLMTNDFFKTACEKVLMIPIDDDAEAYSDLISEFLNLLSVHLRSGIVPEALKLKVAVPMDKPKVTKQDLNSANHVFAFMSQNEDVAFLFSKEN